MLNELLDSDSHVLSIHERKLLEIWDLRDRPLDQRDMRVLVEMYDKVFVYGCE